MNRRSKEGYEEENERGEKMNTSGPVTIEQDRRARTNRWAYFWSILNGGIVGRWRTTFAMKRTWKRIGIRIGTWRKRRITIDRGTRAFSSTAWRRAAPFHVSCNNLAFSLRIATSSRLGYLRLSAPQGCGYPISCLTREARRNGKKVRIGIKGIFLGIGKERRNEEWNEWKKSVANKWKIIEYREEVKRLGNVSRVKKNPLSEKRSAYRLQIVRSDKFKNSTHRNSKHYFVFFFASKKSNRSINPQIRFFTVSTWTTRVVRWWSVQNGWNK